jgi:site-specific recombinase XerD
VQRRVHPHALRATLAVEMCAEGVPLPAIRDVLGHTNLSVTDAYLRRVFPQQAIDAVRNRCCFDATSDSASAGRLGF